MNKALQTEHAAAGNDDKVRNLDWRKKMSDNVA